MASMQGDGKGLGAPAKPPSAFEQKAYGRGWKSILTTMPSWKVITGIFTVLGSIVGAIESAKVQSIWHGLVEIVSPFDIERTCRPLASQGERDVCVAFRNCDELAAHPLDPDRRYINGWVRGASYQALKGQLSEAEKACGALVNVKDAANSGRMAYMLFRINDAQGREREAAEWLNKSVALHYPMAEFQSAARLLWLKKDTVAARSALESLVTIPHPPPDALLTLAELTQCGIGGDLDVERSMSLVTQAIDELKGYSWAPNALNDAEARRKQMANSSASERPALCQSYHEKLRT
jgi:hypothetical protein